MDLLSIFLLASLFFYGKGMAISPSFFWAVFQRSLTPTKRTGPHLVVLASPSPTPFPSRSPSEVRSLPLLLPLIQTDFKSLRTLKFYFICQAWPQVGGTQNVRPHIYLKWVLLFSLSVALAQYPKFRFKSLKMTFTELIRGFLSWDFFSGLMFSSPPTINNPEGFRKFSAFAPKYTCAMPHNMQLCIVSGTYACPLNRRNILNNRHTHLTRIHGSKCDTTKCKIPDRNGLAKPTSFRACI